jgi:hypothetical protein
MANLASTYRNQGQMGRGRTAGLSSGLALSVYWGWGADQQFYYDPGGAAGRFNMRDGTQSVTHNRVGHRE